MVSNALQDFQDGNIIQGLLRPIIDVFGDNVAVSGQYVYATLFGIMFGMLLLKGQDATMPVVVLILSAPILFFLIPPSAAPVFYVLMALSITGIFAKIYLKRGI